MQPQIFSKPQQVAHRLLQNHRSIRSWRAAVAARHAEHVTKAQHLTELSKDLAALPETRQLLATRTQALVVKEREEAAADTHLTEVELASRRANQDLTEQSKKLNEYTTRRQLLEWIRSTKPRYIEATTQERKLAEELGAIAVQLQDRRISEEKLTVDLQAAEADANQRATRLAAMQGQLKLLNAVPPLGMFHRCWCRAAKWVAL